MDKICGIYCIKNLINNKGYIGKSKNIPKRWEKHLYALKSNTHPNSHLQSSFNKYGEVNFSFLILTSFEEIEEITLNKLEIKLIKEYKSHIDLYGYNKTFGGEGASHIDSVKQKISNTLKGRPLDDRRKEILKQANTGRKQSKEEIKKRTEKQKIKILQYDLEMNFIREWSSMKEAANELGIYESGINSCVNGKQKFSKGFIWKRKENPIAYIQKPKKVYMGKPLQVNQYNLEGILIKTWVSISEAFKQTKTSKSSIIRCCKNKQKTANNFIWKYLNS